MSKNNSNQQQQRQPENNVSPLGNLSAVSNELVQAEKVKAEKLVTGANKTAQVKSEIINFSNLNPKALSEVIQISEQACKIILNTCKKVLAYQYLGKYRNND